MAKTLPNIKIPITEWFDITTESGLSERAALNIQNVGSADIQIAIAETKPTIDAPNPAYRILRRGDIMITESGDAKVWGYVQSDGGVVNVFQVSGTDEPQKSGFEELLVTGKDPIAQITAQYDINNKIQTAIIDSGNVTTANSNFVVNSGTDSTGAAYVAANRLVKYRPGSSIRARATALFDAGVANNVRFVGLFTSENSVGFGYVNTVFGILYAKDGNNEVQRLTVTVNGAGNATVTVDGTGYPVTLTTGDGTTNHNAAEIAAQLNGTVPGFVITSNQNTVTFAKGLPEPSGTFSFTGSTATASFSQIIVGVSPTFNFYPQTNWNINAAPWLDPAKGNVYQIVLEYLGYGAITFSVEEPGTGILIPVHRINYANTAIVPSFNNPVFLLGWTNRNIGNTTDVTIRGASAAAFTDGQNFRDGPLFSKSAFVATVDTTAVTVIILRSRSYFNGRLNRVELFPILFSCASQTAKGAFLEILVEPTITGEVIFDYIDEDNSIVEYSLQNLPVSGGASFGTVIVESGSAANISSNDNEEFDIVLQPNQTIAIVARVAASPASPVQASLSWQEDY